MKDFHRVTQHLENMWKHCKTLTQTKCKKSVEILKPYQNKNTGDIIYSHRCCQQQVVPPASFLVSSRQVTARNKSRIHLIHSYARRWGLKQCAAPSHKSKFCNFLEMIWLRKNGSSSFPNGILYIFRMWCAYWSWLCFFGFPWFSIKHGMEHGFLMSITLGMSTRTN